MPDPYAGITEIDPPMYLSGVSTCSLQVFFGPQRKFDHSFQQLICRKTDEVPQDEFLGIKAYKVSQLK